MKVTSAAISCGIYQLYGLSNYYNRERGLTKDLPPEETPEQQVNVISQYNISTFIFSDNIDNSKAGINLAKYIRKNKLGTLVTLKSTNPSHHSRIQTWIWYRHPPKSPMEKKV